MALRLAILKSGKSGKESLFLTGTNYASEALNANMTTCGADDISVIAKIPTIPVQTALVRMAPSKLPEGVQAEQQMLLERTMKLAAAPSEQPGAPTEPVKEIFKTVWEEAHAANEIRFIPKS